MKVQDYSQMIGWLTRDKTTDVPGSMAHGLRNMNQASLADDLEPGSLKDELLKDFDSSQETHEEYLQRKSLERPFNMAEGGRIGFYKAGFVDGKGWKVKFMSKSASKLQGYNFPDKFLGTQYYPSEEAANAAIEARKTYLKPRYPEGYQKKEYVKMTEAEKAEAYRLRDEGGAANTKARNKEVKETIDSFIEKGDYENFKTKVYESQMKKEIRPGKFRRTTGGRVPPTILDFIRERLDAAPGTELFEELKEITGKTDDELLNFKDKVPEKGYISPKDRSKTAIETSGSRKSDAEKLDTAQKAKRIRAEKEAVGTKYASNLELENVAKIKKEISNLNTMFKNKPELINTPQYAKIKEMMEVRIAPNDLTLPSGKEVKAGEIYFREKDSKGNLLNDDYYIKKAKEGKIMSFFDINRVGTQMGKFATNANITPGDFNSAFIQGQVEKFFTDYDPQTKKPGRFYGDTEKLKNVDNYLKSVGVKVKISGMDKRIGGGDTVFFDSKTGDFPHIRNTLNTMGIQNDTLTTLKSSNINNEKTINQLQKVVSKGGAKGKAAAKALQIIAGGGLGYKMEDILKGTGLMDKEYELTASTDVGTLPPEKGWSTEAKVAAGTAGGLGLGTKLGRKILGNTLSAAGLPLSVALNTAIGIDPTSAVDRTILAGEAALAPSMIKDAIRVTDKIKNPLLRKVAQGITTISPKHALKVASRLSPIGIASLAGEGLYQVGKLGYEDQKRFDALSPEDQAAERADQEKFAFDIEGS